MSLELILMSLMSLGAFPCMSAREGGEFDEFGGAFDEFGRGLGRGSWR